MSEAYPLKRTNDAIHDSVVIGAVAEGIAAAEQGLPPVEGPPPVLLGHEGVDGTYAAGLLHRAWVPSMPLDVVNAAWRAAFLL